GRRYHSRNSREEGDDMAIQFNHTILYAHDSEASAKFLAEMLGLSAPARWGNYEPALRFLVEESDFDAIFERIRARKLAYWADPGQTQPNQINHRDGGRGLYFEDPNGHFLEIITRPYGSCGWNP